MFTGGRGPQRLIEKECFLQGKRTVTAGKERDLNGRSLIQSIVFDFDGTLAELHIDFIEMRIRLESLASEYIPITWKAPLPPVLELLTMLTEKVAELRNGAAAEFQARASVLITGLEVEAAAKGCLFPFTRGLLEKLARRGIKSAIITRNCEKAVRMVFPDLDTYCTHLLSREHVERVKPHPDHLLKALRLIGSTPGAALMVGDHPLDIETGLRAGTLTAGGSWHREVPIGRLTIAKSCSWCSKGRGFSRTAVSSPFFDCTTKVKDHDKHRGTSGFTPGRPGTPVFHGVAGCRQSHRIHPQGDQGESYL
jgi:phosphoglycolate phosphatase